MLHAYTAPVGKFTIKARGKQGEDSPAIEQIEQIELAHAATHHAHTHERGTSDERTAVRNEFFYLTTAPRVSWARGRTRKGTAPQKTARAAAAEIPP